LKVYIIIEELQYKFEYLILNEIT